jgi:hypothetical protein
MDLILETKMRDLQLWHDNRVKAVEYAYEQREAERTKKYQDD